MAELSTSTPTAPAGRKVWRRLGIAVAVLVLLVILVIGGLQTPPARRFVLGKVTTLLAAQDIAFSTDGFRYNLLDLSTELRNVRIMSPRLPDGPPFLEIAHARIDLSSWQVLRGRYVVQAAEASGVRLHYFVNEQGIDNLPRPVKDPDQTSQPVDYLIVNLHVPDAVIRYENRAQQIDLSLPRTSLTMQGDAGANRHDITIDAQGGEARMGERSAQLDRASAVLDLGRDDVKVERAEVAAEGAVVNASGTYGPFDQPLVDIALQATADSSRLVEVARLDEKISGQLSLEAGVKGAVDALTVDAQLRGSDLQVRELIDIDVDAAGTYQLGQDQLRVSRLQVSGPIGRVTGEGQVALQGAGPSKVNASVEGLNAEPLMRSLQLPYRLATRVDGRIDAQWPGLEYERAVGDARLAFTPATPTAADATLALGGRVDVSGAGPRLNATLRDVRAAGAVLNGRMTLADRQQLDGTVEVRAANVQATVDALESFLGRRDLLPMQVAGALAASGRIGGRLDAPTLSAAVRAPSLTVGDADGIGVDGDIAYSSASLDINRLDVDWQGAHANASGTIGLTGLRALDLSVRADALQVSGLLSVIERGDLPVTGTLSATAQVAGTAANPAATVRLLGNDLVAYNEALGTLTADARLVGRQVEVTSLQLDKPQPDGNGRILATGSYHLDAERYAVDLRSQDVRLLTLQLPDNRRVTGAVNVTARSSGTIAAPSGHVSVRADDLLIGEYAIGTVTAETTLADALATTVATADRFALTAKSTIGTSRPYPATIAAEIGDLDLSALPVKLQTPLEGRLRARVDAEGPLSDPQSGRADAVVETFAGSWRQQPFTIEGPARLRYADERLTIDQLKLRAEDSTIAVTGNLPLLDRAAPGTITIDAQANLATLARYAPAGTDVAADGRLTLTGTLEGTLKAIDPNLTITVADGLILYPAIEPGISSLNATATIADGETTVDQLTANWGTAAHQPVGAGAARSAAGASRRDSTQGRPCDHQRPSGRTRSERDSGRPGWTQRPHLARRRSVIAPPRHPRSRGQGHL